MGEILNNSNEIGIFQETYLNKNSGKIYLPVFTGLKNEEKVVVIHLANSNCMEIYSEMKYRKQLELLTRKIEKAEKENDVIRCNKWKSLYVKLTGVKQFKVDSDGRLCLGMDIVNYYHFDDKIVIQKLLQEDGSSRVFLWHPYVFERKFPNALKNNEYFNVDCLSDCVRRRK